MAVSRESRAGCGLCASSGSQRSAASAWEEDDIFSPQSPAMIYAEVVRRVVIFSSRSPAGMNGKFTSPAS